MRTPSEAQIRFKLQKLGDMAYDAGFKGGTEKQVDEFGYMLCVDADKDIVVSCLRKELGRTFYGRLDPKRPLSLKDRKGLSLCIDHIMRRLD